MAGVGPEAARFGMWMWPVFSVPDYLSSRARHLRSRGDFWAPWGEREEAGNGGISGERKRAYRRMDKKCSCTVAVMSDEE